MYTDVVMKRILQPLAVFLLFCSFNVFADGSFIDKVYHPYVQPGEKELEWRWNMQKDNDDRAKDNAHTHRFGYGQSINEYWFVELSR